VLILAATDNSPNKFIWMDLNVKKAGIWFSQYPYLENKNLPKVTSYTFNAKDGTELSGYLTLPHNTTPTNTPVVVWPHGGPIGVRDYQYFNTFVQYFVSQGYAVLQVNYRGSGGLGTDFKISGYRQWGKLMQEDVYDSFDWLKTKNLVNTNNACLVGASYGGYVALTAAFQKPDLFKCIVSVAGISDLLEMSEDDYRWKGSTRAFVINEVGDPTDEDIAKELASLSAINNISKIKAPILLIHGRYDTQVRLAQSSRFFDKAKYAGIDVNYVEFKYGTHYLDEQGNRLEAFKKIGEFLQEHLK
jgi:dipeptidyl aminopeptidase/acylaminoacyl peptidase